MVKRISVLMGGTGISRRASVASGVACAQALRQSGYDVTEIDIERGVDFGRELFTHLNELKPDVAFNALQGKVAGNGFVQGILESLGLPYTHSGVLASSLALNKHQAKVLLKMAGVPVTDHTVAHRAEVAAHHVMPLPYVVKPVADSASSGILLVRSSAGQPPQDVLQQNWAGGDDLFVERYIPGRSLSCVVMGDVALGVAEVFADKEFYHSEVDHKESGVKYYLPAPISPKIYQDVRRMSLKGHAALGCKGITRVDFRLSDRGNGEGDLVCLSLNSQPLITPASVTGEIVLSSGHTFEELVSWIVEDASCNR